jgi:UDP-glucose 4-epimerase
VKIVITGASGFIGSHVVDALSPHHELVLLMRRACPPFDAVPSLGSVAVDFERDCALDGLPDRADAVIHLAQSEHFREFPDRAIEVFRVNTASTASLLDYARRAGARTFVLASSGGIYGFGEREFSEDVPLAPRGELGYYLGTKLSSEVLADSYSAYMNVVTLRFFFVYGPRQRGTMLVPRLVERIRGGDPIVLHGPDGIRLNPTYVSDAVAAIAASLNLAGSHKINVAGPNILSMREMAEIIARQVDEIPRYVCDEQAERRHLVADTTKMTRMLTPPRVSFADGIRSYLGSL